MRKKTKPTSTTTTTHVVLPDVERRIIAMRFRGTSSLIVHRFEEKAITQILAKHRQMPYELPPKNPHEDFRRAKYLNVNNNECVPVLMFKKAMVEASTFGDTTTKKATRGAFYIVGEYAPIKFGACIMRVDMVKTKGFSQAPDVRFRPEYQDWYVDVVINFDPRLMSLEELVYTARAAGAAIGVAEWRPQRDGNFGTFEVELLPETEIARITAACKVPRQPLVLPAWVMRVITEDPKAISKARAEATKTKLEEEEGEPPPKVAAQPLIRKRGRPRKTAVVTNGIGAE